MTGVDSQRQRGGGGGGGVDSYWRSYLTTHQQKYTVKMIKIMYNKIIKIKEAIGNIESYII
jgi:hypothetical protein